jgi:polyphosphate glucokinase
LNVLVIDIGGSHVKMLASGQSEPRQFDSGEDLTPDAFVTEVERLTADWSYDALSIGYPGETGPDCPTAAAPKLGGGWVGYDFSAAFGRPVRMVNDAALQALGGYEGGRMLFLGLGTGLGSTLIVEHVIVPLELGCLPYQTGETFADRLGKEGLERHGHDAWMKALKKITSTLRHALMTDYIVLGGGNSTRVDPLPEGTRRGGNDDAFTGGFRLWEEWVEPHDHPSAETWRVVR